MVKIWEKNFIIFARIDIHCTLVEYNRTPELITNRTLVEMLNSIFDYLKLKKPCVRISDFLMRSNDVYLSEFLKVILILTELLNIRSAISISSLVLE